MHRYLLLLRFTLFNLLAAGLLAATLLEGWWDGALAGHTLWLSLAIACVFVYGMALCAAKVWRTSRELNDLADGHVRPASRAARYLDGLEIRAGERRSVAAELLRLRLTNQIAIVRHIANTLVFLGLVGTVIGFMIALSGVEPERSASVDNVVPMVATLIEGMSIALYTTLIGAVMYIWLMVNHRMLSTGTLHLFDAIVELGERRVGA